MQMKNTVLVLAVVVMGLAMVGAAQASAVMLKAGTANPSSRTVYTTFTDVPVAQLNVSINGTAQIRNITITPLYGGAAASNDYAIALYLDSNSNGIVDGNESLIIGYTNISAANNTAQMINITAGLNQTLVDTSIMILLLAKNYTAIASADTVLFNITQVGSYQNGTSDATDYVDTGAVLTISSTAPMVNLSNGQANPGAQTINATKSGLVIQHLIFNNTAATTDVLSGINITPAENMGENADISRIWIVVDNNQDGKYNNNASDRALKTTNVQFADDANTITTFFINGSVVIPANGFLSLLVVYNMGGTATHGEVHRQNITQISLASEQSIRAHLSGGALQPESANFTIDNLGPGLTLLRLIDSNSDGTIDQANVTFNSTIRIIGPLQICNDTFLIGGVASINLTGSTGSPVNNLTSLIYNSGNNSNSLILNVTNARNNGLYDTGARAVAYAFNVNGACGNITDLAGNSVQNADNSALSTDLAIPVLVNVSTHDSNFNGKINAYNLTFSESIVDNRVGGFAAHNVTANVSGINFTISGRSSLKLNFSRDTANNTAVTLFFTEAASYDGSDTTAIVAVASSVQDTSGNNLSATTKTVVDRAPPVVMAAATIDNDTDGKLDAIKLTLTESVNDNSILSTSADSMAVAAGYNVTNATLLAATGDVANDTILYVALNESDYDTGILVNISLIANGLVLDTGGNKVENFTSSKGPYFNTTDAAVPYVINAPYNPGNTPASITGWTRNLTAAVMVNLSELVNCTYANLTIRFGGSTATTNVTCNVAVATDGSDGSATGNLITIMTITPTLLTDSSNHSILVDAKDNSQNALNITKYIKADVTKPSVAYVYFDDTDYAYNGTDVAASDKLIFVFSEVVKELGDATGAQFFRVNETGPLALSAGAIAVNTTSEAILNATLTLGAGDDLIVRGVYNGSSTSTGINASYATANTITDRAGNPVEDATVHDVYDTVLGVPANTWFGFSLPYGINSTVLLNSLGANATDIRTYNGSWHSVGTSALIPYQAYLIKVTDANGGTTKMTVQSVVRNAGVPSSAATSVPVSEGWNLIGVDGYLDNTATDVTGAAEWLRVFGQGANTAATTVIETSALGTALNPQALSAGDVDPYKAYWVALGDLSNGGMQFTGYARW